MANNLSLLIDRILEKYHEYIKAKMPLIEEQITDIMSNGKVEGVTNVMSSLQANVEILKTDINDHLFKEEQILFPSIRSMEKAMESGNQEDSSGCGASGPIQQMLNEHDLVRNVISSIEKDLTALQNKVGNVSERDSFDKIIKDCQEANANLLEHIQVEEEELFPSAIKLENQGM